MITIAHKYNMGNIPAEGRVGWNLTGCAEMKPPCLELPERIVGKKVLIETTITISCGKPLIILLFTASHRKLKYCPGLACLLPQILWYK